MSERRISMISDGPQGPSILYSDGTTEPVPSEDVEPPPLVGDLTFEETRAGFEIWFSQRLVQDHDELIEEFIDLLREQPEVASTDDDTVGVIQVKGVLSEVLRTAATDWWTSRVDGLKVGG